MGGGGGRERMYTPVEYENDYVICSSIGTNPKFVARAYDVHIAFCSGKYLQFATFLLCNRHEKTDHFAISACTKC